jgi:hypothetical protein
MNSNRKSFFFLSIVSVVVIFGSLMTRQFTLIGVCSTESVNYIVVDTDQNHCYNNLGEIFCPSLGESFYGQDAQINSTQPSYIDNGDGTVTDQNTGLMWQQNLLNKKLTYNEAKALSDTFTLAGYDDWRLPTIKELYSLILFSGTDPIVQGTDTSGLTPFIDTDYFDFRYGNIDTGERIIDAQYVSNTEYVHKTMTGDSTVFGVNFADGRIKGYGTTMPGNREKTFEVRNVRGNPDYGENNFEENNDSTIIDHATGLMWSKNDSQEGMTWENALVWVQQKNSENYLGHNDWRLPNAKELQSIVDYTRSPSTTDSAAIDSMFSVTSIVNEAGQIDYPCYWSSTTHASYREGQEGGGAVYVAFGRAMGYMNGQWMDVHGAGAQRSDPKTGNPENYPYGRGPQGDAIRIYNYVRPVRNGTNIISEFPSFIIIPIITLATLAIIVHRRMRTCQI